MSNYDPNWEAELDLNDLLNMDEQVQVYIYLQ